MTGEDGKATYMRWKLEDDERPPPPPDDPGEEHPSLKWLREQWEQGNTKKIEAMVAMWTTYETAGKVAKAIKTFSVWLGKIIMWASGVYASYLVLSGDLLKWWQSR